MEKNKQKAPQAQALKEEGPLKGPGTGDVRPERAMAAAPRVSRGPSKKAIIGFALPGVLFVGLIAFVLYRVSNITEGVTTTRDRLTDIEAAIKGKQVKINDLAGRLNAVESASRGQYASLNDKIDANNTDLNDKFNRFAGATDGRLQKASIDAMHLQTLLMELKARYLKVERELSQWKEKFGGAKPVDQ